MGGLFNNPPTGDGNLSDITPPDFVTTGKQLGAGLAASGAWDDLVNKFIHSIWDAIIWSVNQLAGGLDDIFGLVIRLFTAIQGFDTPGYFAFIAAMMGDLLGIEFDANLMINAWKQGGDAYAMTTIGQLFLGKLASEFSGALNSGTLVPSTGPANTFVGYLTSFAIREGNITFWADLIPEQYDIFRGVREYGVLFAESLGLGRLARRGLQPLVDILVATPMKWQLNQQYRPTLATYDALIQSFLRSHITRDQLNTWMGWLGYSDEQTDILISYLTKPFTAIEMVDLERIKALDDPTAITLLQQAGYSAGQATQILLAYQAQAANGIVHQQANSILRQFELGLVNEALANELIGELPLLPNEVQEYTHVIGTRNEMGFKRVSESEMERAFLGGIIDISTITDYWTSVGYRGQDIEFLTLLLLQKQSAGNRTTAGHTPHKNLTEAELEKAYKAGILTLPQLQAQWTALGYSAASIQILTALITAGA